MPRISRLIILILFPYSFLHAQNPEQALEKFSRQPIEKIYLHFDRENYLAGETAWFKAYLSSDYYPDTISTNLYAELRDQSNNLLDKKIIPVVAATSHGQFDLPDSLQSGYYLICAYTPSMLNQDHNFIYRRWIYIYGKKVTRNIVQAKKISIEFFPEGGSLVESLNNQVAFKVTNENGFPLSLKGKIVSSRNIEIVPFSTYHNGMGSFEFTPEKNETYYAIPEGTDADEHFQLPPANNKGIVISLIPHPQGNFFEIKQATKDPDFRAAFMIGQMQNHAVFRQELSAADEIQGVINTLQLHSGILQVTVFNSKGQPLAERLCFVNNNEYRQKASLVTDTVSFSRRGRNRFSLHLQDTIQGSFSISITDPDYDLQEERSENIYSRLLLNSDLRGYIHQPAWYFWEGNDSATTALDLLMMTNGWRRFKWTEILNNNFPPALYKASSFISLAGKALLRDSKRPFANKQLLVIITSPDKKRITQFAATDKDGNFLIDSLLFFGKARILFTDTKGKKSQYIDVVLNEDSLTRSYKVMNSEDRIISEMIPAKIDSAAAFDYNEILKANGLMLENVTVRVVKKTPLEQVEERYTNGPFSGFSNKSVDLVNNDEAKPYNNIFDYLRERVNGLQVFQDGLDYTVFYRQGASVSSMGNIPMTLFLDEVETDASFISAIPANQIALVKVYSSFTGATGNAPGGVLAIYTKKGEDYVKTRGAASYNLYQGYSIIKEFYAPDYRVKKETDKPDHRITLDWRPDILCNYIDPVIPFSFYNNDRSRRFKVVIEGMTTNGKMVSLEKIIEKK